MGEVWLAHHELLGRNVAIKFVRVDAASSANALIEEAKLMASLKHPAIVDVYDCGLWQSSVAYLVMEWIEGENLTEWLERVGPRPAHEAVAMIAPIARGLHAVHDKGVIHRDIKPENILRCHGDASAVKLIDFGIARPVAGPSTVSVFSGTPYYMAPEQIRGEHGDRRVDVWALGATLFELMCGKPPFEGTDVGSILAAALQGSVPYPRAAVGLDGALWRTLMQCLRLQPEQRFATSAALAEQLELWLVRQSNKGAKVPSDAATQERVAQPSATPEARVAELGPTTLDQLIKRKLSSR
jgi:serine/threonine-protein kinase